MGTGGGSREEGNFLEEESHGDLGDLEGNIEQVNYGRELGVTIGLRGWEGMKWGKGAKGAGGADHEPRSWGVT